MPLVQNLRRALPLAALIALGLASQASMAQTAGTTKPRIEKAADLPRFSYPVKGKLDELVRSPEAFSSLATPLRRDVESVLATYDIPDKATQRDLLNQLAVLDYLEGNYDGALARVEQVRALQDKPANWFSRSRWVTFWDVVGRQQRHFASPRASPGQRGARACLSPDS